MLCYTQGIVAFGPILFGGCIPPTFTPPKVKPNALIISPHNEVLGVVYWFHAVRPFVRPSICPSVLLPVRPASHVRSVAHRVLVGSISYLHILSTNFRRCVGFKVSCKISKSEFLAFLYLQIWLCLVLTSDLMWITCMGNHGAARGISERRRSILAATNQLYE